METWELIKKRVREGWEFQIGEHISGLRGFWACFVESGSNSEGPDWIDAGHAMTIDAAIRRADAVRKANCEGVEIKESDPDDFLPLTPKGP